jgi:hypothetical protein
MQARDVGAIRPAAPGGRRLRGSRRLHLVFGQPPVTMYNAETGTVVNYPQGQMVKRAGKWTMVNQMTSLAEGSGDTLSHWAYMVQSQPGSLSYQNLPFANESIPDFMSSCPAGPQIDNAFDRLR